MRKFIPMFMLQLFADGEGSSASGEAAQSAEKVGAGAGLPKGRKINTEASTLFGVQPTDDTQVAAAEAGASSPQAETEVEKKPSLEELLKNDPELKKEYDSKFQKALDGRFKGSKAEKDRLAQAEQILSRLAPRYKVKVDGELDLAAFDKAVQADMEYYSARALQNGTSVEIEQKLDEYEGMKIQQEQKRAAEQRQAQEAQNRERFNAIVAQGAEVQKTYPAFDLNAEMGNKDFVRLLHAGVPVKTAYEVLHKDAIMQAGMAYAVQQTAQKVSSAVQANAQSPTEGVLGNRAAANHVVDPSKLTKAQREEVRRRVRNGEKIVW